MTDVHDYTLEWPVNLKYFQKLTKNAIILMTNQRPGLDIGSYEKDLRAKIFRRKFFEKLFYKLSEILKG